MGSGADTRRRGQGGFTLVEGVLCVAITAIGLLAVVLGLLTSVRVDNRANEQQRLNLAVKTFSESVSYSRPRSGAPCGATTPPPTSATLASDPASHAKQVIEAAVARGDIQRWMDQRVLFVVTDVEYGAYEPSPSTTVAQERFVTADALVSCPAPVSPPPSWPVIRISVTACYEAEIGGVVQCSPDAASVDAQFIKRGGRNAS